jgi:hypothetical protein
MQKDILNRKIKQKYTNHEKHFFGKYYVYNNKIYRIVRLKYNDKFKTPFYILTIMNNKLKTKNITIYKHEFDNMKFYDKKPKTRKNNYQYRMCYFDNSKMKENFYILENLYSLGYENYSRTTSISFHQYGFSTINKKGEIMSTHENEEELISNGYRNIFDFYKV